MSERLDLHRLQDLGGGIQIARSNAVKDVTLMAIATEYRRDVSRAYLQLTEAEIDGRFSNERTYAVSRKYDGEAVFLYFDHADEPRIFAFNAPSGRLRLGLRALQDLADKLSRAGVRKALLTGECYLKREGDGPRPNHSDILRASFRNRPEEQQRIGLALYDIIMLDGRDWRKVEGGFQAVWDKLEQLVGADESQPAHRVTGAIVKGAEIAECYQREVAQGEEGVVVRRLDKLEIFKIKPMLTVDGVVIGYVEDQVENTYGVASLLVALTAAKYFREFARVGSGFSDDERVRLLKELSGEKVDPPLTKTDSDGRPVQFVRPRLIVEIRGESLETERLSGQENLTPTYELEKEAYLFLGVHPLPRLIHATFSRLREDKDLAAGGASVSQVLDAETERQFSVDQRPATESRIHTRRVFIKPAKDGSVALRKFVLIETDGIGRFPFCVLYTDVSLGRKEPIQTTLKVANTSAGAEELFEGMIAENIKKGWQEDGVTPAPKAEAPPAKPAKKAAKKASKKAAKKAKPTNEAP